MLSNTLYRWKSHLTRTSHAHTQSPDQEGNIAAKNLEKLVVELTAMPPTFSQLIPRGSYEISIRSLTFASVIPATAFFELISGSQILRWFFGAVNCRKNTINDVFIIPAYSSVRKILIKQSKYFLKSNSISSFIYFSENYFDWFKSPRKLEPAILEEK